MATVSFLGHHAIHVLTTRTPGCGRMMPGVVVEVTDAQAQELMEAYPGLIEAKYATQSAAAAKPAVDRAMAAPAKKQTAKAKPKAKAKAKATKQKPKGKA